MRKNEIKFDFDDLLIIPKSKTNIVSRYTDINPYYNDYNDNYISDNYNNIINYPSKLPLMTAPMDTVINMNNLNTFLDNNIVVTLPRTIPYLTIHSQLDAIINYQFPDFTFFSMGIEEMEFLTKNSKNYEYLYSDFFILDVANGHMQKVYNTAQAFKQTFPQVKLMVGNIANPNTYEWYARSEFVDFVRIGIGNGSGCLTTKQTSVGYPMASLIYECYLKKKELIQEYKHNFFHSNKKNQTLNKKLSSIPLIVADGGMKNYSDIIKALGLGADYIMAGSVFNKTLESAGQNYLYNWKINPNLAKKLYKKGYPIKKQFYGMSTKIAQKKMGKKQLKTSEGVVRKWNVEYTLPQWKENFEHYLRSAMSYSNAKNLKEFIGNADFELITENAFNRFNK